MSKSQFKVLWIQNIWCMHLPLVSANIFKSVMEKTTTFTCSISPYLIPCVSRNNFFLVQKQVTSWNHWEGWRCEIILGKVYLFNPFTEGASNFFDFIYLVSAELVLCIPILLGGWSSAWWNAYIFVVADDMVQCIFICDGFVCYI